MGRTLATKGIATLDLARELERLPSRTLEEFAAAVPALLAGVHLDPASLAPYAFFSPRHYTRNLVHKTDLFEMLALCWSPGQMSSIHNHRDQHCFMLMGEGSLENQNYRVLDRDPARGTCRIEETTRCMISAGMPLAVDMDEPVHQIRNLERFGGRALSIHIYARPFDSCEVYSPDQGTYKDVALSYWSTFGKVVARET